MPTRSLLMLLLACLATWAAVAAPVPKPKTWEKGWDKPINPDGDCKFVRAGGVLTIEVPGKKHYLDPERHRMNAPRLLREVEGDFKAQVRLGGDFRPVGRAEVSAGLLLMETEKTPIRLECATTARDGLSSTYVSAKLGQEGPIPPPIPDFRKIETTNTFSTHLRLERKGDKFFPALSQDGQKWTNLEEVELKLPAKLKLGVFATSITGEPFKPRFDRFKLTLMGKKSGQ